MKALPKVKLKQVSTKSRHKKIFVSIKDKQVSVLDLIKQKESETTLSYTLNGNIPTVVITISNPMLDFTNGDLN